MPKFFCDYCDVYLTHDSMSVRKAHNSGRNHLRNVVDYYQQIGHEKAQSVIDSITSSYADAGQAAPGGIHGLVNPSHTAFNAYNPFAGPGNGPMPPRFPPQGGRGGPPPMPFPPNMQMPGGIPFPPMPFPPGGAGSPGQGMPFPPPNFPFPPPGGPTVMPGQNFGPPPNGGPPPNFGSFGLPPPMGRGAPPGH
ncbi:zf-U1-domain-containing protein [Tothia fuscella]|uniref:U1 small nuclear ribonucleoprotein C n=1 Tax=Tothia fuscella TaxID=1048955 RepID=A0A9P4NEQ8_9PEZI|nr:zf-U1-domain-containing protein [Tothia fuscella]